LLRKSASSSLAKKPEQQMCRAGNQDLKSSVHGLSLLSLLRLEKRAEVFMLQHPRLKEASTEAKGFHH
jgi:hypothetical protein